MLQTMARKHSQQPDDPDKRFNELKREYLPSTDYTGGDMASAGIELGLVFLVLALGGWWADKKLGTAPWLLLVGCAIGIVGGLYRLIQRASRK